MAKINDALECGTPADTFAAMHAPAAHLPDVDSHQGVHYHNLLTQMRHMKAEETGDPTSVLWYEEILEGTRQANKHAIDGNKSGCCLFNAL